MASALSSVLGSAGANSPNSVANAAASTAPSESVFLQLLVSQIKNQDPLNPTDSTQFVSQLAQFSELEQVVAIRGDIETGMQSKTQSATDPSSTSGTGTSTDSSNLPSSTGTSDTSGTSNNSTGTSTN